MNTIKQNQKSFIKSKILSDQIKISLDEYIKENNKNNSNVEIGNSFCEWILYNIFELREDEVLEAIEVSGRFDNGIDAVFEYNNEICVMQGKYNNSHQIDAMIRFLEDCQRLSTEPPITDRSIVKEMCMKIRQAHENSEPINCFYITNNEFSDWEYTQLRTAIKRINDSYKNLNFNFFDHKEIQNQIEIKKGLLPKEFRDKVFTLPIEKNFEDFGTIVTMVKIKNFAEFVNKGGNTLFHSNIRNYLKGTKINKGIKRTLKEELNNFWFYNNGVTIVCDEYSVMKGLASITAPQIVNGCQTAKTLADHFKKMTPNEIRALDQEGYLLVKIIRSKRSAEESAKKELRDNITRYTNSQNAVRGLDFYALDAFQRELKNFFSQLGYYYEIQRGSFITETISSQKSYKGHECYNYLLDSVKGSKKFVLPAKEIIQSFTAGLKLMPNIAYGRANDLTPLGDKWEKIINEQTKELPIEHFLFPYLVLNFAKSELNYKNGSTDFRKNAGFLFVTTYYLFIMKFYNQISNKNYENPTDIDIKFYKVLFSNQKLNKSILKQTHKVLLTLFRDSAIVEEVGDNLRGFLQNKIHKQRIWNILETKIDQTIEDIEFEDFYNEFLTIIKRIN
ncbi:AIPR family protein [Sporosarcina sp. P34]|uniref:AIPR family protein n=1 Tax=Sporosarcina sp. P34 TaxID=2048247 RepID=UPI001304580D|nr:AIPR family protein [Sporosarcina sp. P34]